MATIIPKEQLSAYQRWEMDSFQQGQPVVELPTAAAIEAIQRQAHEEGLRSGFEEGRQQGFEQGYSDGQLQAAQEARLLHQFLTQVREQLGSMETEVSGQMLDLALAIARQMVRQALAVRPELLLTVIQEALGRLPQANQHPQLFLNPADAEMVRQHLSAELQHGHWRIQEDERILPGGCRLETAQCEMDLTLERRWHDILENLGRSGAWLTQD